MIFAASSKLLALAALALPLALPAARAQTDEPLPALGADMGSVTVSGISAGAFMAVQLHVAHSRMFKGAGVVAGGPFVRAGTFFSVLWLSMAATAFFDVCCDWRFLFFVLVLGIFLLWIRSWVSAQWRCFLFLFFWNPEGFVFLFFFFTLDPRSSHPVFFFLAILAYLKPSAHK
jgi:hypothetical protein